MKSASPARRLAEVLLKAQGEELETFVRSRRDRGRPWRLVARDLYEITDGQVDIVPETLRSWVPDVPVEAAS